MTGNMKEAFDTAFGYFVVITLFLYSNILEFSDEIMTIGGLVLLGCRLYVDGGKAVKSWRDRNGSDRG